MIIINIVIISRYVKVSILMFELHETKFSWQIDGVAAPPLLLLQLPTPFSQAKSRADWQTDRHRTQTDRRAKH